MGQSKCEKKRVPFVRYRLFDNGTVLFTIRNNNNAKSNNGQGCGQRCSVAAGGRGSVDGCSGNSGSDSSVARPAWRESSFALAFCQ
ncbi:hypothetical protein J6590_043384 [Homalodisca vitripennis]|nr:hypothetical protein J6590_043384 [Homalodisca vitripennis]